MSDTAFFNQEFELIKAKLDKIQTGLDHSHRMLHRLQHCVDALLAEDASDKQKLVKLSEDLKKQDDQLAAAVQSNQ